MTTTEILALALEHHQAGRLAQAEPLYQMVLQTEPRHLNALYLLGLVFDATGRGDQAVAQLRAALEIQPDVADIHNHLGNMLARRGQRGEACKHFRAAVQFHPNFVEAHANLGNVLKDLGQHEEAADCYRAALRLRPEFAEVHSNLGNALMDLGRPEEAEAAHREAIRLMPGLAAAHNNLGTTLKSRGKLDEAAAAFREAIRLAPQTLTAHYNLGVALVALGRCAEAAAACRQTIRLSPNSAEAHNSLALALQGLGQMKEAIAAYQEAIQLRPDYAEARYNLGCALTIQGRWDEAAVSYRQAVRLRPDHPAARGGLIHALQNLCQWDTIDQETGALLEAVARDAGAGSAAVAPFNVVLLPVGSTAALQLQSARHWVKENLQSAERVERSSQRDRLQGSGRLKIGYLSADFHNHATAHLVAELFEKHDRARFEILGFSYGPDDKSPMRRRLVQAFDRFLDLRDISDQEAARQIQGAGLHVLVDLKGHQGGSRPQILALAPAPIQVNYLGYPGTMGASFVDYILVDPFLVPADQQPFFSEKLVHLPGSYQANDSRREIAPQPMTRDACGLPAEGLVFCCFNNSYKITLPIFSIWMRLLQSTPGSVLWLFESNRWAAVNLRREAEARGVAPDRLVFARLLPGPEHLARYRLADLFLDTFPVNAHTTASDALWGGCPVLTLAGQTLVSRVAGSLLHALGLPELVTASLEEYESRAMELAHDRGKLTALRARLQANRLTSPLFDGASFARHVETALETMWQRYVAGEPTSARRAP